MQRTVYLSLFAALVALGCSSDPPPAAGDAAPADTAPSPDVVPPDVTPPDATPPDVPGFDAALDVAPDVTAPDVPRVDIAPDAAPDVALDAVPDVTAPDVAPDAAPDVAPDAAPDVAPPDVRGGCTTDSDCLGLACCNGVCVNAAGDPRNCGGCGRACPTPLGLVGICMGGTCMGSRCPGGVANCDGLLSNGCESDPATDRINCGACGRACAAGQVCSAGACVDPPCPTGQSRCGGACVDTASSAAHCGRCDNACPARANAAPTCAAGACGFTCNGGFADCDGNAANGCEADLRASASHCGRCGMACASGLSCVAGGCALVCATGQTNCGSACADLNTSAANCGACGRACRAGQTCSAGACVGTPTDCAAGTTGCGDACVNTATSAAHCGGCGRACAAGVACVAGACAPTCSGGTTRCGAAACFNLTSDPSNCGACGTACGLGQQCVASACTACPVERSFRDDFNRADGALGDTCYRTPPGVTFAAVRSTAACATGAAGEGAAARAVPAGPGAVTVGFDFTFTGTERAVRAMAYSGTGAANVVYAGLERVGTAYQLAVRTTSGAVVGTPAPLTLTPGPRLHLHVVFSPSGDVAMVLHPPGLPLAFLGLAGANVPMFTFDRAGFSLSGSATTCADDFTLTAAPCAAGLTSCADNCVDTATSLAHCGGCGAACTAPTGGAAACTAGSCVRTCPAGYVLNGAACENVAASLSGLRWELPCRTPHATTWCPTTAPPPPAATLGGSPTRLYDVRLRFRGVVELKSYTGGTADGNWYVGGSPVSNVYNIYSLTTSTPSRTYYLNAGAQGEVCVGIDYTRTIRVQGGATLTLTSNTGTDDAEVANHGPIVVPGIAPAPAPFDGQFVQMDVLSVTPVP